jgi:uncharacterized membrane protein HdeD (DUF308 family)
VSERERTGLTEASRAKMQRRLCAIVLSFEGLVVFFGALVASRISDVSSGTALAVGGGLALACVLASGALRGRHGILLGWILQVLVIATGFVVTAMFFMGVAFACLWLAALRIGAMVRTPIGS